ncbi:conserved protein, unknown function [Hepatocystis sp. ex Piliocolobus tephrosceles]|nr:conserved protein, unknown function [Hepatocystis sp. ex Piliocolobus tephrosceles]
MKKTQNATAINSKTILNHVNWKKNKQEKIKDQKKKKDQKRKIITKLKKKNKLKKKKKKLKYQKRKNVTVINDHFSTTHKKHKLYEARNEYEHVYQEREQENDIFNKNTVLKEPYVDELPTCKIQVESFKDILQTLIPAQKMHIPKNEKERNLNSKSELNKLKPLNNKKTDVIEKSDKYINLDDIIEDNELPKSIKLEKFTKLLISKLIDLKAYIKNNKSMLRNIMNHLFNEFIFLTKFMSNKYNILHKVKFFSSLKHYLNKLKHLLTILYDLLKKNDEHLLLTLYIKIKKNFSLLYYVGRILFNYLTCIAYANNIHIIVVCVSRIHTIFKSILLSEPFKTMVPTVLHIMNRYKR